MTFEIIEPELENGEKPDRAGSDDHDIRADNFTHFVILFRHRRDIRVELRSRCISFKDLQRPSKASRKGTALQEWKAG
ncbi:hypothetical protein PPNSA23_17770 [Phyllobacterium phragmitis]|uniref:Uncharacterized protein n=1 Tax=Phyllobacterium phragmitis TaxID=2670329 RepID=A0ABQ0GYT6_9HYPH